MTRPSELSPYLGEHFKGQYIKYMILGIVSSEEIRDQTLSPTTVPKLEKRPFPGFGCRQRSSPMSYVAEKLYGKFHE